MGLVQSSEIIWIHLFRTDALHIVQALVKVVVTLSVECVGNGTGGSKSQRG
jgi:hypothetical protein